MGGAPRVQEPELVARRPERNAIDGLLDGLDRRSGVAVVVGEPGIGKSTLWGWAVGEAEARGVRVLTAHPAEAELAAPWSGLADLLAAVPDEVLEALAPPRRRALAAARLEDDLDDLDPRAVWMALTSVVVELAASGPVLVAVDDLHWLDPASTRALAFLARRLPDRGVGVLAAMRPLPDGGRHELLGVPGSRRLDLGPIDVAATGRVVRHHLGLELRGPALLRIHQTAAGNPMFAVELARVDAERAGRPPAVPMSLQELVGRRVQGLSADARTALVALAAAGRPSTVHLAAAGLDAGLAEAESAGLARVAGGLAVLTHPLVGASAYNGSSPPVRRDVHTRLAAVVTSPEDRARHAALGSPAPDAAILAALDDAAALAGRRGATEAAADLATLALELTPDGDAALLPRHLAAGEHRFRGGESDEARRHFTVVLDAADVPHLRARAALRMAELAWETEPAEAATQHAARATRLAVGDPDLLAEAEVTLSRTLGVVDLTASAAAAERALAVLAAPRADGSTAAPGLRSSALLAAAEATFELGLGLDRERFQAAIDLEAEAPPARVADRATAALASLLKFVDDLDGSRRHLQALRVDIDEEGDESSLPFVLGHVVLMELWAGRWDDAEAAAIEHLAFAERTGQEAQRRQADYNLAVVTAHRGDDDRATTLAAELAATARADADAWSEMTAENVLGFLALARGDHRESVAHFEVGYRLAEGMALREPGRTRHRADHIEALLAVGDRDRAIEVLEQLEQRASAVDRRSALGGAARCRALLAAADGDEELAERSAARSLRHFDHDEQGRFTFERARTLLVIGRLHRRARRKRAARLALTEARDVFAELGARRFTDQADHELGRIGLRPATPDTLTATEQKVAELAAGGLTTRQVADAAFLSPKTVEANLTRVYRKLGVRSRAELGAWFARTDPEADAG